MQKLTIVKIIDKDFHPTNKDAQRWNDLMVQGDQNEIDALSLNGKLEYFTISRDSTKKQLMLVKLENEHVTPQELEAWREIFSEIENDPYATIIYSGGSIDISVIDIGDIAAVE